MWYSRFIVLFFSDWVCQSLCQKRMFFGLRQKDFFLHQILAVIPYFVFLIWAMTFLYSCFILSEISNYLTFSWIGCFIISAFPILSLLFSVLCRSLLRHSLLYQSSGRNLDPLLLSGLLQSCHPGFLSTALLRWFHCFSDFFVFIPCSSNYPPTRKKRVGGRVFWIYKSNVKHSSLQNF